MQAIDEQTVESTWKEVAGYEQDEAVEKMSSLSEEQSPLLALVVAQTEELEQDARELTIYLFFVVHAMFRSAFGKEIPEVTLDAIMNEQEETRKLIDDIESLPEESWESSILAEETRQPWVMRYIVEALMEADEGPDPVELTEDDRAMIFLAMRSVVTLLDQATGEVGFS